MFVVSCLVVVTAILVPLFISLGPSFVVHQSGVVLVTGASSGIGRHAAFSIAARGYTVFAGCRKAVDQLELQHEAARLKVDLRPILLDVTDRATISASLLHISAVLRETNAPLVGVVNNAGISDKQTIEGASDETFQRVLDVNVLGVQRMVAAFGPLLRQHKGRVVNIGSLAGEIGMPLFGTYAASKAALKMLTEALRLEWYDLGCSVSLVAPGTVQTPIFGKQIGDSSPLKSVSVEHRAVYARFWDKYEERRVKRFEGSPSPDTTTTPAIEHALFASRPHPVYAVAGFGPIPGWLIVRLTAFMNDSLLDYVRLRWF